VRVVYQPATGTVVTDFPDNAPVLTNLLWRISIMDDTNGRSVISEHFNSITKNPNNIVKQYTDQYGSFEVRESFFIGPSGKATTFESTFEVMPDSSHRFITTIPKNGATK